MTRRILVFQPYVPAYRVPLFDRIAQILAERGAELAVAYGKMSRDEASKGDKERPSYSIHVSSLGLELRGKRAYWRTKPRDFRPDVVVSELALGNLNAIEAALSTPFRRTRHVLWGHGGQFTSRSGRLEDKLEAVVAKSVDHCMTYSERGRLSLIQRGLPASKVTAIGNAIDNEVLRASYESITDHDVDALATRLRLPGNRNALYVGTFTEPKRIPFLIGAAEAAYRADPDFRLIVAGSGPLMPLVRDAAEKGRGVRFVGRVSPTQIAHLGRLAQVMWMPGRVGLVALDAAILGMPILTTDSEPDAPEVDFLTPEYFKQLPADVDAFAAGTLSLLKSDEAAIRPMPPGLPTVANVAASFVRVVAGITP